MDYHDFSTDRKNDYTTKSENGCVESMLFTAVDCYYHALSSLCSCPLTLQQEGHTSVFSRHSTSHEGMNQTYGYTA